MNILDICLISNKSININIVIANHEIVNYFFYCTLLWQLNRLDGN